MKKVIRLTESDLAKMVKRVVKENKTKRKLNEDLTDDVENLSYLLSDVFSYMEDFIEQVDNSMAMNVSDEESLSDSDKEAIYHMEEMIMYRDMFERMLMDVK